jgi:hypothetical protein
MKRMTPQEIFKKSSFVKQTGEPWEKIYAMVGGLLQETDQWRALRENNSIFVYNIQGEGKASVTLINADKPDVLRKNIAGAAEAFKKAGFNQFNFEVEGRQFSSELRKMGFNVMETPISKTSRGSTYYRVEVHV